jgi:hypothetical protein
MNKTAQTIHSILALVMLACVTSHAMADISITQQKVNQIIPGRTTEAELVRAFGPPATKTLCPPEEMTLDWFWASPIAAQNYIPAIGPAFGGARMNGWELWVVLRPNGTVRRYIAYGHYVNGNGETRRYIIRSGHYSNQTDKNVRVGRHTDLSRNHGRNQASSEVVQAGW